MEMSSELSPSMIKFKLEEGELVVETKKLDKKSSFFLETEVGVAVHPWHRISITG